MTDPKELVPAAGEFLVFIAADEAAPVDVRIANGMVRLTQQQIGPLRRKDVRAVTEHRGNVYEEGEPDPEAT